MNSTYPHNPLNVTYTNIGTVLNVTYSVCLTACMSSLEVVNPDLVGCDSFQQFAVIQSCGRYTSQQAYRMQSRKPFPVPIRVLFLGCKIWRD
jgi:hypothetical protein